MGLGEFVDHFLEQFEREADYVGEASFSVGDEAFGSGLDGVGSGFVHGFSGLDVAGDFCLLQGSEFDPGGVVGDELVVVEDEGEAGDDGVAGAGEAFQHGFGVLRGGRLGELAVSVFSGEGDDGVSADDDGLRVSGGDGQGFGAGESGCGLPRIVDGEGVFIHVGNVDGEFDSQGGE